jgi:hypothetical protein
VVAVQDRKCISRQRPDGIYEFRLLEANAAAFNELLNQLAQADASTPTGNILRYIVDLSTSGIPPLQPAFQAAQKWLMLHPDYRNSRMVFLAKPDLKRELAQSFARLFSAVASRWQGRFMDVHQHNEAINWLLAND